MREQINFSKQPKMETLSKIASDTFASTLGAITSRTATISIVGTYTCDAKELFESYADQTLVVATESNTGFEAGMLFKTRDITMLADYMLAGDGDSKDELDDEIKDAAKELASQLVSAVNVPVEEGLKKKFTLKVDDITKNMSSSVFQSGEYIVIDLSADIEGKVIGFLFFLDGELSSYFGGAGAGSENSNSGDVASSSYDMGSMGGSGGYTPTVSTGNQNLDLLLDIDIPVSVRMGSARLFLKDILGLGPGNIVELEQNADESIELAVNDKVIARGEVVIVDGYFGFRIKEIVSRAERIKKLKD